VERLIKQLDSLVAAGNTVLVVEHDMSIIAAADWIIDIGPGAGEKGGQVVAEGIPEKIAKSRQSITGKYIKDFLHGITPSKI
jgi:excinuclease ABC subunit A